MNVARPTSALVTPRPADRRALVVLIENGGLDLGIPRLVDSVLERIPEFLLPKKAREEVVRAVEKKLVEVTDNLLESVELLVNGYASAAPEHFGEVVILRNSTALHENLRDTLVRLSRAGKLIDLLVLTHGRDDSIALSGGTAITGAHIRALRSANGGAPLRLRAVYMMSCVGSSLNKAWLAAGAKVSSGAFRNNYLPEPTTFFFFLNWKKGLSFADAVTTAYLRTIGTMREILRDVAQRFLPGPIADRIIDDVVDLESRQFIKDSRPVIEGDGSVTLASDELTFEQSVAASIAYTVVPLGSSPVPVPRTATLTASPRVVDFIKSFEGFRPTLYDDAAGHCTIGYGTLVHLGPCNGDPSEAPFKAGITEPRASELVRERLREFEREVNDRVTTELSQQQFDALVSFTYNVGTANFGGSTLLRKLNTGDYDAVPVELVKWVYAGKRKLPGLVRRREAEARMFEAGDYSTEKSWMVAVA